MSSLAAKIFYPSTMTQILTTNLITNLTITVAFREIIHTPDTAKAHTTALPMRGRDRPTMSSMTTISRRSIRRGIIMDRRNSSTLNISNSGLHSHPTEDTTTTILLINNSSLTILDLVLSILRSRKCKITTN